jgi:hypothetical protein
MALTIDGTNGIETNTDTGKIKVGASDDISIYHSSGNSFIQNDTGILNLTPGGDAGIQVIKDGAVKLAHNDAWKFETTSSGVKAYGRIQTDGGNIELPDNAEMIVGNGDDLKLLHDGTNSYIRNTTGNLIIEDDSGQIYLQSTVINIESEDGETQAKFTADGSVELYHNNGKRLETKSDGVWVGGPSSCQIQCYTDTTYRGSVYANTSDYIGFLDHSGNWVFKTQRDTETEFHQTNIVSNSDDSYNVGLSNKRWDNIYASNGTIQTSDRNEKNTIVESDLGLSFVNKLKPVSYKFNGKTRTHYGLIAQDVETTLDGKDFAGFIKSDIPEEKYQDKEPLPEGKAIGDVKKEAFTRYGLRYTEFISPLVKAVQELSAEVETLKTKVAALEAA